MNKTNFNLKNLKAQKSTLIYLCFNYANYRLKVSTGLSINPKFWNPKAQQARLLIENPEHEELNNKLKEYANLMEKLYSDYHNEGITPAPEVLKDNFLQKMKDPLKSVKKKGFWDQFNDFVEYKRKELNDVRDYDNSLRKHLKEVEKRYGSPLSYNTIKQLQNGFIDVFDNYLVYEAKNSHKEKGLTTNTIGKQYKNLKVFLNWSFDRDIFPRFSLKHLITKTEEVDSVYLNDNELDLLENKELKNDAESLVRDMFLIGCETALRFSDFTRLNKNHIRDGNIYFRPKKTEGKSENNKVVIPISSRLNRILIKHKGEPPVYTGTITEFNRDIRHACAKAGIDSDFVITKKQAGKFIEKEYKKYNLVSSHTCRRTFCTLKFLNGMPAQIIMKFSGHKTERAFLKYLKIDAEAAAKKYVEFFK